MFCYNCASTNIPTMITNVTTCISEEPTENCAKQGSGYAKISYTGGADLAKDYKYLYSSGNEFNSVTGGWVATNSQGNGRTEKLANNLHIYCSNTGQSSSNYTTANAIVNDGYTKLHVVYEISRQLVSNQYAFQQVFRQDRLRLPVCSHRHRGWHQAIRGLSAIRPRNGRLVQHRVSLRING